MKTGVISEQGKKAYMEDRFYLDENFNNQSWLFALICDGHVGAEAAEYTKDNLPRLFSDKIYNKVNISQAYIESFEEISDSLRNQENGTTAISFLIKQNELIVANAGDSRAIIVQRGSVKQMSKDHRLSNPDERKRILSCGGKIVGPYACLNKNGRGLMPTRTIGDQVFKEIGIISTPEIVKWQIDDNDLVLVTGTDGLFDELKNHHIANIARKYIDDPQILVKKIKVAAQSLFGGNDNITIITVIL